MKMARSIPVLSSVCLSLVATTMAAWAENYPLDSIDFDSQGQRTHITLHTGSIVPVDKVLVSRDKMMIDIDQVDATQTIKTNFSNAENISHVVIQPLNDHKVRLIIRGEDMQSPSIAFDKIESGSTDRSSLASSLVSKALSEHQPTPVAVKAPAAKPATAPAPSALSDPEMPTDPGLGSLDESYVAPIATSKTAHTPTVTHRTLSDMPAPTGLLKEESSLQEPAATPGSDPLQKILNKVPAGALNVIPYGALFLVLSILGILVGQKFRAHRKNVAENPEEQEWMDTAESDASRINGRQSFRELANAYRTRHQGQSIAAPRSTTIPEPQRREDMIGLGAMQPAAPQASATLPKTSATQLAALKAQIPKKDGFGAQQLEKMLDIIQKEATGKAIPNNLPAPQAKKRAANPYVPPTANKANEIQKAGMQARNNAASAPSASRPVNRAAAAGPSKQQALSNAEKTRNALNSQGMNNQQGPLPSNPQVLDFLRNVADLMEKEGKPAIAQNIQRNLGSQAKLPR